MPHYKCHYCLNDGNIGAVMECLSRANQWNTIRTTTPWRRRRRRRQHWSYRHRTPNALPYEWTIMDFSPKQMCTRPSAADVAYGACTVLLLQTVHWMNMSDSKQNITIVLRILAARFSFFTSALAVCAAFTCRIRVRCDASSVSTQWPYMCCVEFNLPFSLSLWLFDRIWCFVRFFLFGRTFVLSTLNWKLRVEACVNISVF